MQLSYGNKKILQIAIPSIVSNITVPLLGLIDVTIVGHLGSAAYIGAIAVGGMLFNIIYWIFGFLRMGTSGMTSQAYGAAAFIHAAVVVLIHRTVARVGIVSHAVLIKPCVNGFVIAEQRILALPRPDGSSYLAHAVARLPINTVVHLAGDRVRRVVLDQRAQSIHNRKTIAACRSHVVITENDILMTVLQKGFFCQFSTLELRMGVSITHRDSPAADAG